MDDGIGILKNKIPQLFALQKNKNTKGTLREKCSGFGLVLVQDLVKLNQGTIQVWSKDPTGTTFEILLPKA